jgi:hypothetical protein
MLNFAKRTQFDAFGGSWHAGSPLSNAEGVRVCKKSNLQNEANFLSGIKEPASRQSQFKANPKPISRFEIAASRAVRPSTHALPRVAQDEDRGFWPKEYRLILSHDAKHRESKDARHRATALNEPSG